MHRVKQSAKKKGDGEGKRKGEGHKNEKLEKETTMENTIKSKHEPCDIVTLI